MSDAREIAASLALLSGRPAEASTKEIERLRAALADAGHYVACCPPPPEATGELRILLLEERGRIAQAARSAHAPAVEAKRK
jgi:hypothetical protein